MPIGPNLSGSCASMTQYTYLPRLAATVESTSTGRPPCRTRSTRCSATAGFASRRVSPLRTPPLARGAALAALGFPDVSGERARVAFGGATRALRAAARRPRPAALTGGFRMFSAPAGFFRGRLVEDLPDFL